jgi:hypothetical protein
MHAPSLVPHKRGNWAYVTGLAEAGVLHASSLAQTCIQVTKQEELDEICIPWAIHGWIQGTKQAVNNRILYKDYQAHSIISHLSESLIPC